MPTATWMAQQSFPPLRPKRFCRKKFMSQTNVTRIVKIRDGNWKEWRQLCSWVGIGGRNFINCSSFDSLLFLVRSINLTFKISLLIGGRGGVGERRRFISLAVQVHQVVDPEAPPTNTGGGGGRRTTWKRSGNKNPFCLKYSISFTQIHATKSMTFSTKETNQPFGASR